MAHPRTDIRRAVAAQLAGNTSAGERVYRSRILPWEAVELPALAVYTLEESVDTEASAATAPRELERSYRVAIEGGVMAAEDVDDAVDTLAQEVETAMHADCYLAGSAADSILESTDVELAAEGERIVGHVRLTYLVTYRTYAPAQVDGLGDFTTADVRTNLGGAQAPEDEAQDRISLPQG